MKKKFICFAIAGLILSSCSTSLNTNSNTALTQQSVNTLSTTKKYIESDVSMTRLQNYVGILSGKTALPSGKTIPERGSVDGKKLTKEFISSVLTDAGYTVEKQAYSKTGENIFTKLMANQESNEYILLGAHFDSVNNAGANDNATGTAIVLEAASVLKNLKNRKVNIIFALFDEEEKGLLGSRAMANQLKKQGLKILSAHTLDMIGWDSDGDKVFEIEQPDSNLWDFYLMVNKNHGLDAKLSRTSSGSTDHDSFRELGFVSVGVCEEWTGKDTTPYYHKKTDTYETVNFEYLTLGTKLVTATIGDLSIKVNAPFPSNVPHGQFPKRARTFTNN